MIRLSFLGVIHKIFQLTGAKHAKAKLAGKSCTNSYLRPHAARGYRIKLQRQGYTARRTTDNMYIMKNRN